jgi:hypothetical protein
MGYVTFVGFKEGDINKLVAPLDGEFKFCGIDKGYEEYKFLYIADFTQETVNGLFDSGVCVKQCPKNKTDEVECKATAVVPDCKPTEPYPSKTIVNICFPTEVTESMREGLDKVKSVFENSSAGEYANDLFVSSTSCYISIAMSIVYCLAYIYLMSAFAEPIAWFCVFLLQAFLLGSTGALWMYRTKKIETH